MLLRQALILGLICGPLLINSQYYSGLEDPFSSERSWGWRSKLSSPFWPELRRIAEIEDFAPPKKDREPLGPDYQEPIVQSSEDKPVIQPKPTKTTEKPSFNPDVLPGGVVNIDAGDFSLGGGISAQGFPDLPNFSFASTFGSRPGGLFGLGDIFGDVGQFKPWWKGPNVCIERSESTDDEDGDSTESSKNDTETIPNLFSTAVSLSNCQQFPNKYECVTKINNHGLVKTFTVTYKCCYGFQRTKDAAGCTKQIDLKPLMTAIEDAGAKEFRNVIKTTGLEEKFDGNFTVFVPTDSALNDFTDKMLELNKVELMVDSVRRRRRDVKNAVSSKELVLNHIIPGFVDLTELENEQIIYSENNNSSVRINVYPTHEGNRLYTANCARVSKPNNLAKNGIVHITEGVVVPALQNIQDIISENKKLSHLKKVLENTDLMKLFKNDGHFTIFAPSDEAFNKLDESLKQKLLKGHACAPSILKHHIVAHTICSGAIVGNATTHNIEDELLNMERTADDQLVIEEKAKIVETDIMATNGVIHLIDTVLIPESAMHINDALKNQNLTKFQALIEEAGIIDEIDSFANSTVFAPSDKAFEDPATAKHLEEIKADKTKLKELILYHTVQGQMQSCDMSNNEILKSNDNDKPLRVNLYSTLPLFTNIVNRATVNCAKITGYDEKSCGSVIHEINKVLIPPASNIFDVINSNDKYTTLRKIIKDTEIEKVLKESNHSITLLAPTDEAFASIPEDELKELTENKEKANTVIKNHILTEVLCCSGVGPQTWGFNSLVSTLAGNHHQIGRTGRHQIRIGRATVISCDNLATNGIVHTINRVLLPQRPQNPNFGLFLFDF